MVKKTKTKTARPLVNKYRKDASTSTIVSSFQTSSVSETALVKRLTPGSIAPVSGTYVTVNEKGETMDERIIVVEGTRLPPVKKGWKYKIENRPRIESLSDFFVKNPERARDFVKEQKKRFKKKKQ